MTNSGARTSDLDAASSEAASSASREAVTEAQRLGETILVGDPDGMERLWTPHRAVYVEGEARPSSRDDCPFCASPGLPDEEGLIVARGETCFVVLNLYPYNPGHLLICPYRHVADFTELTDLERNELSSLTATAMTVLRQTMTPAGMNLGMNQGAIAGAGIAAHLHQHVVPRWQGDANFFPIIAQTKAVPELLATTRDKLARYWSQADETSGSR